MSESLNYRQMKQRSVAARSFRVKIPSSNSTTFKSGQTINIDLPGNMPQYYNFNQMYLKMKVKNNNGGEIQLDRGGGFNFIKRLQVSTAGSLLQDLNNFNVLALALLDTDSSQDWKGSNGNILLGTRADCLKGETIAGGGERVFCIPMVLNVLGSTTPHRLIPACSLGAIQFKLTLEEYVNCGVYSSTTDQSFTFSEVEMVCLMTELSPAADKLVKEMNGDQFNILCTSWMNSGANLAAGNTTLTANLGISVSSLERIIMISRPSSTLNVKEAFSLGNRFKNKLKRYQFIINSEGYPARPIECEGKCAEAYAEYLISNHSLVNFREGCGIQNGATAVTSSAGAGLLAGAFGTIDPALSLNSPYSVDTADGTTAGALGGIDGTGDGLSSNIGTFLASVEFESALSDGKSSTLYSGISTISSTTQYRGEYGDSTANAQLDFFAQYSVLLSLDMRGTGVWQISI